MLLRLQCVQHNAILRKKNDLDHLYSAISQASDRIVIAREDMKNICCGEEYYASLSVSYGIINYVIVPKYVLFSE